MLSSGYRFMGQALPKRGGIGGGFATTSPSPPRKSDESPKIRGAGAGSNRAKPLLCSVEGATVPGFANNKGISSSKKVAASGVKD